MSEASIHPSDILPCGLCEDGTGETMSLLERVSLKDRGALEELHTLWAPAFLGVAFRILGDRKAAGSATRRAFVRIWRNASTYNPHSSPPLVWAASFLREESLRLLPKTKPDREPPLTTSVVPAGPARVLSTDDRRRLQSALDHLTPKQLATLEQAVFLGFAKKRPSAPAPSAAVKSTIRSALDILRANLSLHEL